MLPQIPPHGLPVPWTDRCTRRRPNWLTPAILDHLAAEIGQVDLSPAERRTPKLVVSQEWNIVVPRFLGRTSCPCSSTDGVPALLGFNPGRSSLTKLPGSRSAFQLFLLRACCGVSAESPEPRANLTAIELFEARALFDGKKVADRQQQRGEDVRSNEVSSYTGHTLASRGKSTFRPGKDSITQFFIRCFRFCRRDGKIKWLSGLVPFADMLKRPQLRCCQRDRRRNTKRVTVASVSGLPRSESFVARTLLSDRFVPN